MSLLAHHFETASCHKCALSLLALALFEISLATCLQYLKSADCGVERGFRLSFKIGFQPICQMLYIRHAVDTSEALGCV